MRPFYEELLVLWIFCYGSLPQLWAFLFVEGQIPESTLYLLYSIDVRNRWISAAELNDFLLPALILGFVRLLQKDCSFEGLECNE
jgi:hypothetical protein